MTVMLNPAATSAATSLAHALQGKDLVRDADYFVEICCQVAKYDSSQEAHNLIARLVDIARSYSPRHRSCR